MRRIVALLTALLVAAGCSGPAAQSVGSSPSAVPSVSPIPTPQVARPGERLVPAPPVVRPVQPVLSATIQPALVADHCVDRDLAAPSTADINLVVLDRTYALGADYAPADLVPAARAGFTGASSTKNVRAVIIDDLAAMRVAWLAEGLSISIDSAYRSYVTQVSTFNGWAAREGIDSALVRSARPGHSEHQLGTTLDLTSPGWAGRFGDWATQTSEGAWLAANAWRYGFAMSYPLGSQEQTCFSYEPWHYRWIGREPASAYHASGLYLRQFLERYVGG